MNRIALILFSFLLICCAKKETTSISKNEKTNIKEQSREDSLRHYLNIQDSIKILEMSREEDGNYAIFIDYNRSSDFYDVFDNLTKFNEYEQAYYNTMLGKLKDKTPQSVRAQIKTEFQDLLGSWMNLESYKNELYVESSCEFARNFIVTDSLFLYRVMDGPNPYIIEQINKISSVRTQLILRNETNEIINVDFYLIDKSRDTYLVLENIFGDKKNAHYMTKVKSARKYDIVEHLCENEVEGFEFDKVDYEKKIKEIEK